MDSKYDLVVFGATFSGIGAAVGTPKSLIIERSTSLGWEYIDCFCKTTGWEAQLESDEGCKMKYDFLIRGILTENGLNFAGAAHYLNKYLLDKGIAVMFMSDVINVVKNGVYEVELVNESGRRKINCDHLYNALPTYKSGAKSLNGILCCTQADTMPISWTADIVFEKYVLPNTAIIKVAVDETNQIFEARKKMHDLWENRPRELNNWKIGLIADKFDYQKDINPIQAFEIGYRRGV